jgi:hypothetical protein
MCEVCPCERESGEVAERCTQYTVESRPADGALRVQITCLAGVSE